MRAKAHWHSSMAFAGLRPLLSLAGMARSYRGLVQLGRVTRRSAVPGAISSRPLRPCDRRYRSRGLNNTAGASR
jgi:hypothetical protein